MLLATVMLIRWCELADVVKESVIPISLEIARVSTQLDFRSDPADELIAAISIVEGIPLPTRDHKILASQLVPLA
ncbi:MAG: hypothetical protein M3X11_21750 [Acidobacteriota bacterium]|nr:hypothetical protein [Acidobacteriota bacterium]